MLWRVSARLGGIGSIDFNVLGNPAENSYWMYFPQKSIIHFYKHGHGRSAATEDFGAMRNMWHFMVIISIRQMLL